ncbi:MAG: hypothetical protein M3537_05880 [Chloroflexota bacterium]|nr:hypothetical protein [Chloroflexota bacterium]
MAESPLLPLSPERIATEQRRAREKEDAVRAFDRKRRRVMWQCVALSFTGVPVYVWSWHLADPRTVNLFVSAGFFMSYALPFFRWLAYHLRASEEFGR